MSGLTVGLRRLACRLFGHRLEKSGEWYRTSHWTMRVWAHPKQCRVCGKGFVHWQTDKPRGWRTP